MKLISVIAAISLNSAVVLAVDAWSDTNLENSVASNLIIGALGSEGALSPCKCTIPRQCTTGNTCECFNNAAVSCWLENGQSCRLDLQNCGSPNLPPTSSNSQFPPCLFNPGTGANPLPPCAATASCRKLDSTCYDRTWGGPGGCIGICVPRNFEQRQKQTQLPKQSGSSLTGWQPRPTQAAGPNWGTGAPLPTPWTPPPGGPSPVPAPTSFPSLGLQSFGACPANIKCPGNNICIPDPKHGNTFLCIQPLDTSTCGTFQNVACQGNRTCVADPRIQCKGQGCTGLCV